MPKKGKSKKAKQAAAEPECKPPPYMPDLSVKTLVEYYRAIFRTITCAFKPDVDRMNLETCWGNYMIFRTKTEDREFYFIYPGCMCDLKCMEKDMQYFPNLHEAVKYIVSAGVLQQVKDPLERKLCECDRCANKICKEYQQGCCNI